jgi:hypothetical protein
VINPRDADALAGALREAASAARWWWDGQPAQAVDACQEGAWHLDKYALWAHSRPEGETPKDIPAGAPFETHLADALHYLAVAVEISDHKPVIVHLGRARKRLLAAAQTAGANKG